MQISFYLKVLHFSNDMYMFLAVFSKMDKFVISFGLKRQLIFRSWDMESMDRYKLEFEMNETKDDVRVSKQTFFYF